MTRINTTHLTRSFGETAAVNDVNLDLVAGSFTALLGASGCGKSTLLRLIAGFERPDAGEIAFDGQTVARPDGQVEPENRKVGIVFQSYALWPHMNVGENVAYPLKTRKVERDRIAPRVAEVLDMVGLSGFQKRPIDELSGGQRQRVALARCLVAETSIILFDEPLANLDMHLRSSMVELFREIHQRTRATIVYVTHDQAEALALADRVAVMSAGKVLQFAAPEDVYRKPANVTVAGFVGRGALLEATANGIADGRCTVDLGGVSIDARCANGVSGPVSLLLRPEALRLADTGLPATVLASTYKGPVHEIRARVGETGDITFDAPHALRPGELVRVAVTDAWAMQR